MVSRDDLCYYISMFFVSLNNMRVFFYCLFSLLSLKALAQPDDNQKPIHFSAGQMEWDQQNAKGVFSQKVLFIQGTTEINAESGYSIGDKEHQFKKIVLLGSLKKQASFKTVPNVNDTTLFAYADKMVYLPLAEMIKLIGHVKINQAQYHFQAPYLEYHLTSKKILSKSSASDMTTIIIEPEKYEKHA